MGHLILKDILIIFTLSIPLIFILNKFKISTVLGFLFIGALIGPHGFALIQDEVQINILAEIGVALLLFSIGLEFSFESFKRIKRQSLTAAIAQILFTFFSGILIGWGLGWNWFQGIYFGCILSLSSTAIVMSTLADNHLVDSIAGRFSTAILIFQDLALIPMLVLLQLFGLPETQSAFSPTNMMVKISQALLFILFVFAAIRYFGHWFFRHMLGSRNRQIFIISIITVAIGLAWLTHWMGLSFALGAFIGGVIVGVTDSKYQALSEITPFRYIFNSLFFVSIGMLVNFQFIQQNLALVCLLLILIPLLKTTITTLIIYSVGNSLRIALMVGIYIGQIGEFSFLIAYVGKNSGMIDDSFYQLIVATAVITMFMTPLMIQLAPRFAQFYTNLKFLQRLFPRKDVKHKPAKPMTDHVIICGFGPYGQALSKVLEKNQIAFRILDLNPDIIHQSGVKKDLVFFGDGASPEILYYCGLKEARLLAITVPDYLNSIAIIKTARSLTPKILIVARSKYENEAQYLRKAGANVVISEETEGGLEMAKQTLRKLGIP